MPFDFQSSTQFPVKSPEIPETFTRMYQYGKRKGSRLKNILPLISEDSVLVFDTNFACPLQSLDLIRFLLEQDGSSSAQEVAKYVAHSSYGEMKTIFELAKRGRVISPPYIAREVKKKIEIIDRVVKRDKFNQKCYFTKHYRNLEDVEFMRDRIKHLVGMSRTLLGYINKGSLKFSSQIDRAQEQAKLISKRFNLPPKNRVGDKPSLEDIMVACLGVNVRGTLCTEDRDCYTAVEFLRERSSRSSFYVPPICSSVQRILIEDKLSSETEYFPDRFGRFTLQ